MDMDNNIIAVYNSVTAAAQVMGATRQGIDKVCKGTYGRTACRFIFYLGNQR